MSRFQPPQRKVYLKKQKEERGRNLFGVFPAFYPKELLWTMNILPVEIWDPQIEITRADMHLQTHICSVARLGLELILQGKCDYLDGFFFPHTCDSIQNLSSIVNDFLDIDAPCYFLYYPETDFRQASKGYYREQLKELTSQLERQFGTLSHEKFRQSVEDGKKAVSLITRLYDSRARGKLRASNEEFYRVIRQGEFLHPDDFIPLLQDFFDQSRGEAGNGPAVVLSGILPNPPGLLSFLDGLSVRVGHDDLLSCGRRFIPSSALPDSKSDDPFEALVDDFFKRPSATGNESVDERIESLFQKIEQCDASGVIFNVVKFCEPELFYLPQLLEAIEKRGVKTLVIESELNQRFDGRLATRVEAFIEMIK